MEKWESEKLFQTSGAVLPDSGYGESQIHCGRLCIDVGLALTITYTRSTEHAQKISWTQENSTYLNAACVHWGNKSRLTFLTENSTVMEQIQPVQPLSSRNSQNSGKNLFSAEMDRQGFDKSIPWRNSQREAVDQNVPTNNPLCCANGL